MVYRYTRDARMLAAAQKTADSYLGRLGGDPIPNWDFDAPSRQKDSSAAAAAASALFELSSYVGPGDQARYQGAATAMLDALASPAYLSAAGPSILLHGVGNYPLRQQVDVGLIYGDYYFVEALARRPKDAAVGGGPDAGSGGADAGSGNADAGPGDAGAPDAGPGDAGPGDAGPGDAGPGDAGPADAGPADAGPGDAGPGDADGGAPAAPQVKSGAGCASGGEAETLSALVLAAHLALRRKRAWFAALSEFRRQQPG